MSNIIEVVAAVRRMGEKYWVCRRTDAGSHGGLAGMWEFPGGAVEDGESLAEALRREMWEEFGVRVAVGKHLDTIIATAPWDGGQQQYRVHFFDVTFDDGHVQLRCHDLTKWCTVDQLQLDKHLPSGVEFNKRLLHRYKHPVPPDSPEALFDELVDYMEAKQKLLLGLSFETAEGYAVLRQKLRMVLWRDEFWPNNPGVEDAEIVAAVDRLMDERADRAMPCIQKGCGKSNGHKGRHTDGTLPGHIATADAPPRDGEPTDEMVEAMWAVKYVGPPPTQFVPLEGRNRSEPLYADVQRFDELRKLLRAALAPAQPDTHQKGEG